MSLFCLYTINYDVKVMLINIMGDCMRTLTIYMSVPHFAVSKIYLPSHVWEVSLKLSFYFPIAHRF